MRSALRGSVNFDSGWVSLETFSSAPWQFTQASCRISLPPNALVWQASHASSIW